MLVGPCSSAAKDRKPPNAGWSRFGSVTVPQNLKIPNQTFFLSDTVWQTVFLFFPFSLMRFIWWSWASGYQTNLSLCFVGKLLPD